MNQRERSNEFRRLVLAKVAGPHHTTFERDRVICGAAAALEARAFDDACGGDMFTECSRGHEQLGCDTCDGTHCYRSCDEVRRAECRARWLEVS